MAGNVYGNRKLTTSATPATTGKSDSSEAVFSTGLFRPKNAASKAIGTIQIKEDVVLKAGSYINLYEVENPKSDSHPIFRMQVRAGQLKARA